MSRLLMSVILCCFFISASAQSPDINTIIHPDSCKRIVETLAADSFLGRLTATPEGEKAGQYIANEFSKAGCAPGGPNSSFFVPFTVRWGKEDKEAHNVIAILPGKSRPHQWIIFSAHYDHIGTKGNNPVDFLADNGNPEKGDTVFNGANDNASGISALILLSRYFAKANNNERTIAFMAFSGEELGLYGSTHTSYSLTNHDSIVAMINMDMLGVPVSRRNKRVALTGSFFSDLQTILNKRLYEAAPGEYGKRFFRDDPYRSEHLFRRSDNYPFAQRGVPAHTIIATHPRHKYYHSLNDEPHTLDYDMLAKITRSLAIGTAGIIDGSQTPTRINPLNIKD